MAEILEPGGTVELTPADQAGRPERDSVAYVLRVPRQIDKARFRRAVAAAGASYPSPLALEAALRDGVAAMLDGPGDGEARARCLGVIDAWSAARTAILSPGADGDAGAPEIDAVEAFVAYEDLAGLVAASWRPFADLRSQEVFYREVTAFEAARHFVAGWRGLGADCAHRADGTLTEAALAAIPDVHLHEIRARMDGLFQPDRGTEKNSGSPSGGRRGARTSTAARNTAPKIPSPATAGAAPKSAGPSRRSTRSTCWTPATCSWSRPGALGAAAG